MYNQTINYMMGMTIYDWQIIGIRPNKRKGYVLAQCICGKTKEVRGRTIRNGQSKNCGCTNNKQSKGKQRIPGTNSALRVVYSNYSRKATRMNWEFELDILSLEKITSQNCYYCGQEPKNRMQRHSYIYYYNGIDRVDNSRGYTKDNIVPCCSICNTKKGAISLDIINKIAEFLNDTKKS